MKIILFNTKLARYYMAAGDTGFKTTAIRNYATTFATLEIAASFIRNVIGTVPPGVVVSLEAYKQPVLTALEKFVHEAYAQHRSTTDIASSLNRSVAAVEQAWSRADDKLKEIAAIAAKDAAAIAAQQPAAEKVVVPTTTLKLDTTVYKSGRVARNTVTGCYYVKGQKPGDTAFPAVIPEDATLLDAGQMAVVRYTYTNVEAVEVATLLDEVCAALNTTGRVGWFSNATQVEINQCALHIDGGTTVRLLRRDSDGVIECHLRGRDIAYLAIANLSELAGVLDLWR